MDEVVKLAVDKNEDFLRRNLVMTATVIDRLYEAGIITDVTRRLLISQPCKSQVTTLTSILRQRSMDTLRKFIYILKTSMNGWLAESLLNTPITEAWSSSFGNIRTLRYFIDQDAALDRLRCDSYVSKYDPVLGISNTYTHNALVKPFRSEMQLAPYKPCIPARYAWETTTMVDVAPVPLQVRDMHRSFKAQKADTEDVYTVLREEESAIKGMLHRNARDQEVVRHEHRVLSDLDRRLEQISLDATHLGRRPVYRTVRTPLVYSYRY